jgi:hypothetical protein
MRWVESMLPLALLGCASTASYVHSDDTTLGRVVIYRNGVAYFERTARVDTDVLRLAVPADKIDDFLKSLTITDLKTGQPAPVAFPSAAPTAKDGLTEMNIQLSGPRPHQLKLTYVTEAPSWKPSYRIVLGQGGKVEFQGWAVVDNTSGEDWTRVKLGVGSSSALSFRFDLRSLRTVTRETLQSNDLFAQAPPMGGAAFGQAPASGPQRVLGELTDGAIARNDAPQPVTVSSSELPAEKDGKRPAPAKARAKGGGWPAQAPAPPAGAKRAGGGPIGGDLGVDIGRLADSIRSSNNQVVIEGYADDSDRDKSDASLTRANRVRDQLIRNGIDPSRVVAQAQGQRPGRKAGVRIVEGAPMDQQKQEPSASGEGKPAPAPSSLEPIGTSHFESPTGMTIARGTSAMISIFSTSAEGEVVYLFDPESPRGSSSFAFRAVRIKNPTESVLESGPVTVFGDGRFIGEGLSEPIPAKSTAFVPFALDRQVVVESKPAERDEISRILAVQRGILTTEVQHVRKVAYTLHNRSSEPASIYVRHTVAPGFKLKLPTSKAERIGGAHLFRVQAAPHASAELVIEEATPVQRSIDIRSATDLASVRVYLASGRAVEPLKSQLEALSKLQQEIGNTEQKVATVREQMQAYRTRMDELHVQIVTLRAVKTGGPIMKNLEKKLTEMSDRLSQATIDLASLEEQLLVKRIRLQDGIAELTLEPKPD